MNCPKCDGQMWDNREGKKNPKAPDFKCKDKDCDGVIWPPRGAKASGNGTPQAQVDRGSDSGAKSTRDDARHFLMRTANLLKLCHNAARSVIGEDYDGEDARTLFIAASREGYIKEMPDKPANGAPAEPEPEPDLPPEPEEEESF